MQNFILTLATAFFLLCVTTHQAQAVVLIQVLGLSDMNLPNWGLGDPAVSAGIDLCVYSTMNTTYSVTVASVGGFKLKNGANSINYSTSWDDGGASNLGSGSTPLINNVALGGRRNANYVSPVCLAGANARLNLKIIQADMVAALAGTYTGTVTIMISPN